MTHHLIWIWDLLDMFCFCLQCFLIFAKFFFILFCSKISWKCFLSAYFRIWFSLLRYLLYVTSLAVVFNFISFAYNLFFVLIASVNDWDSHGFRVLNFFVTILSGKCLLNNLSKVESNQVKDFCAFPEIYKVSQSIYETALWMLVWCNMTYSLAQLQCQVRKPEMNNQCGQ